MQKAAIKTNEEKQLLVQEYLSSGKPKTVWCAEKGIPYQTFYKWMKHYSSSANDTKATFIPLQKTSSAITTYISSTNKVEKQPASTAIRVEVNGCNIVIPESVDSVLLSKVIKAVMLSHV